MIRDGLDAFLESVYQIVLFLCSYYNLCMKKCYILQILSLLVIQFRALQVQTNVAFFALVYCPSATLFISTILRSPFCQKMVGSVNYNAVTCNSEYTQSLNLAISFIYSQTFKDNFSYKWQQRNVFSIPVPIHSPRFY